MKVLQGTPVATNKSKAITADTLKLLIEAAREEFGESPPYSTVQRQVKSKKYYHWIMSDGSQLSFFIC